MKVVSFHSVYEIDSLPRTNRTGLLLCSECALTIKIGSSGVIVGVFHPLSPLKSHKYTMILGFVIAIVGCLAMRNRFTPDTGFMSLFPCLLIYGVGLGFPSSLSVDVPLSTVSPQAQNSCSGLVSTGQNLGLSMGTGIMGVVLTLGAVSGLREAINTYSPMKHSELTQRRPKGNSVFSGNNPVQRHLSIRSSCVCIPFPKAKESREGHVAEPAGFHRGQ